MCPKCSDYIGRCGECGADLRKGTASEPIGKPVLPPRRPRVDTVTGRPDDDDPNVSRR
jgi:hypothetical protein